MDTAQLDNLLVAQKNEILRLINDNLFGEARTAIKILRPLWKACGYSYKTKELYTICEKASESQSLLKGGFVDMV